MHLIRIGFVTDFLEVKIDAKKRDSLCKLKVFVFSVGSWVLSVGDWGWGLKVGGWVLAFGG